MRYREASPQMDVFSILTHEQVVTQAVKGISKLSEVIDWELFRMNSNRFCAMPSGIGAREAVLPLIRC